MGYVLAPQTIRECIYETEHSDWLPVRTFNGEAGTPTLDKTRRLIFEEIPRAKREGVKVLNSINGYLREQV